MNKPLGKGILFLTLLLFTILVSQRTLPLTFLQDPALTPDSPSSGEGLNCTWIPIDEGTMQANVTWYNNSQAYSQEDNISCINNTLCSTPIGIPGSSVFRGNFWNCTVILYNQTASLTRSVKVNISNADPVMSFLGNISVLEDVAYLTTLIATDVEGDTPTWFSNDANFSSDLFTIDQDTGTISFTADVSDIGNHTMDIIVIDGNGGSDAERVVFNVISVNDVPVFTSSFSNQTIYEAETYSRLITATDEESNTFNFTLTSPTITNLTLVWISNTTANLTFSTDNNDPSFEDSGNHTVNITVYEIDNTSVNTTGSFNLDIRPVNHDPVLAAIVQQNETQGQNLVVNVSATDIDPGDVLTFSISTNCSLSNPWSINTSVSSSPATGYINLTLNNSHVVCRYVNITVTDTKTTDYQTVFMNITNTNDAPVIYNISTYAGNTGGNNITNISAYFGAPFTYRVNATDIDMLTYQNDTITYSSNDTLFAINSTDGTISFDINNSMIGNHTVKITATDLSLVTYTQDLHAEFHNNTIPNLHAIAPISCAEDTLCTRLIEASDPDPGETLTFESNDTTHFQLTAYNTTAKLLNYTPAENMIGNHSILVRVTDSKGAEDNETFTLTINNTNDAPFFDMNQDNTTDSITFGIIVEETVYTLLINATDHDLQFGDNLSFNVTFLTGQQVFNITKTGNRTALVNFTPNTTSDGNYTANFTVSDLSDATAWQAVNFTIYNISYVPVIDLIMPYYNTTLGRTVFSYENASLFSKNTNINFTENTTVTFNATMYDPDGSIVNVTAYWYRDGSLNTSTTATANNGVTIYFGFFDSGTTTINLTIRDGFFSTESFRWTTTIANLNRAPLLLNPLVNLTGATTINSTTQLTDYFSYYSGSQHFLDRDDDRNNNSMIRDNTTDPNETFNLTVTATACSYATLTISGKDLTVEPTEIGTCFVNFTATDNDSSTVSSTPVRIDIGAVPEGETTETPVSSSGGGGSTTRRVVIPQKTNVDVPKPVELIVPGRVIMYENKTMKVPIFIRNNWNGTLTGITLFAYTNNTGINMSFSASSFKTLSIGEEVAVTLIVDNYRDKGPYEISIIANVTDPKFSDTGTIFVNSIEQTNTGTDVEIKIAFAKDLLTSNKECQELNELLDKADIARESSNYDLALTLVDSAVNGCKYLINPPKKNIQENPQATTRTLFFGYLKNYGILILTGLFFLTIVLVVILIMLKKQEITELKKLE